MKHGIFNRQVLRSKSNFDHPSMLNLGFYCLGPKQNMRVKETVCEGRRQAFSDFDPWEAVLVSATQLVI
jgi:hypothetical protein